jgi:hypothetical protein
MQTWRPHLLAVLACLLPVPAAFAALGDPALVGTGSATDVTLVRRGTAAPIHVAATDWPGVQRAARDLAADIERVTGVKPALPATAPARTATIVLAGTIGRSSLLDDLIARGKLDVTGVRGKWESFVITTVDKPMAGVDRALIIAGSDKRGTIYGIYEVSQQIGVSPWYWWADVPVTRRDTLSLHAGRHAWGEPSVRYRGIFLNDEAPDLTNWIRAKFGNVPEAQNPPMPAGVANYGREFYTRLFELMLRLRANYLWPAMWNNAFNEDDPENARLADEYGIVMGTSHQEPMLRAQKEWDRRFQRTIGTWNYARHPDVLEDFWREGVRRNRNYESIVTMGLRGANDTEMAPGGPEANRALLERIVERQRDILRAEVNPDITQVPQLWALYKEVQEYYEHGMRVPDDVTLLWAEDNWGNVRRLPTAAERTRAGGAGIYYHFDYHGGPRSYQWLNTNPIPKIWEQMSLAKQYGADRIWIVNVGHFKGYEFPMEFFLEYAWNTERWNGANLDEFTRLWAAREFGAKQAGAIADLMARYTKYNGRRKPEMLAPDTFSLVNYREAETIVADWRALTRKAEQIAAQLPATMQDAFHQLLLFPVKATTVVNEIYLAAGRNALYARQGRASAASHADAANARFADFMGLVQHYNGPFASGKWAHFMDQPVLGYTSWADPPQNSLRHLRLLSPAAARDGGVGVAVEGSDAAAGATAKLPRFDALNRQRSWFEVFGRGSGVTDIKVTASQPWIVVTSEPDPKTTDRRYWVDINWSKVSPGLASAEISVTAAGKPVTVITVDALNPQDITRATLQGFAESQGVVSIEPEHFTGRTAAGAYQWMKIEDYGRTLSGMRAEAPVDAPSATPGKDSPCLEYRMYLFTAGPVEVTAITAPTLNFVPERGVRYAVSIDEEPPQIVTLVPQGYQAQNRNAAWEKSVGDNAHYGKSRHSIAAPGYHTLKIWMVDPAVVMQKLIVDLGGLKPSYLGPPESFRAAR